MDALTNLGVEVVLGERVKVWPEDPEHLNGKPKTIITDKGREFHADLVVSTFHLWSRVEADAAPSYLARAKNPIRPSSPPSRLLASHPPPRAYASTRPCKFRPPNPRAVRPTSSPHCHYRQMAVSPLRLHPKMSGMPMATPTLPAPAMEQARTCGISLQWAIVPRRALSKLATRHIGKLKWRRAMCAG